MVVHHPKIIYDGIFNYDLEFDKGPQPYIKNMLALKTSMRIYRYIQVRLSIKVIIQYFIKSVYDS